jgi:hypothetical protein
MDSQELENLHRDIEELKRSIRKANPFLRSIMEFRSYAILSIPFGIAILAYFIALHFISMGAGSYPVLPEALRNYAWIGLAAILFLGLVAKLVIVNRKASEIAEGATFITATKAIYGSWFQASIPLLVAMAVVSIFVVSIDRSWYVVPVLAVGFGIFCCNFGVATERKELFAIGWYMIASGLASLFFIESAPFLWSAVVWAGAFLSYGVAGLVFIKPEKR